MSQKEPAIQTEDKYKLEILEKLNKMPKEDLSKTQRLSEFDNKWNMNNKIIELFENNIEKDQKLRFVYAIILVVILGYSDTTFNLFVTGGIAEVFVLVRVIVKYLFKDNLTNALNIILENNNKSKYKKKNNNKTSNKSRTL